MKALAVVRSWPRPLVAAVVVVVAAVGAAIVLGLGRSSDSASASTLTLLGHGRRLNGASIAGPFTVRLSGGSCVSVKFLLDGHFVATDRRRPFFTPLHPAVGTHKVKARCYDKAGQQVDLTAKFTVAAATGASPSASSSTPTTSSSAPTPTTSPTPTLTPTQPSTPIPSGPVVNVSTSAQLTAALAAAKPGQTIHLADGTYSGQTTVGDFTASFAILTDGITLTGEPGAVLDGNGPDGRYGLYLHQVSQVILSGFTVANASKGIVIDSSSRVTMEHLSVHDIGAEGVHFRDNTTNSVIENSDVYATGLSKPQFGEGIYVGSAVSNWAKYSQGAPDASNGNRILNNTIYNTGAENIDIKEGTVGGTIEGNNLRADGIAGKNSADSWVDIKGNNWVIAGNFGTNPTKNPEFVDGFQTHVLVSGDGMGNVFRSNVSNLNGASGYAFNITSPGSTNNVVACSNTAKGAGSGLANEACS